jgi:23S rRNA pseudouridine1911/1915/1917 synthase
MTDLLKQEASSADIQQWIVHEKDVGVRLDQFLAERDFGPRNTLGITRSRLKKMIENGYVTVDDALSRPAKRLRVGERISLRLPPPEPTTLIPEEIPLDIHYEDDYVVVINKPQGLVVHPGPGHAGGTLVNALLYTRVLKGGDPTRPGIVHRLDKDTSGLMVVAKREDAHAALAAQFHHHSVDRQYRVLVSGHPPLSGIWQTLHGRNPSDRRRFTTKVSRGKTAISQFSVCARFKGAAELRVVLKTGRTHQVRVHCYDHGFPVLGDPLYTPRHLSPLIREIHAELPGQALHAELLGFDHPLTDERLRFEAPPPPAYRFALDALKLHI